MTVINDAVLTAAVQGAGGVTRVELSDAFEPGLRFRAGPRGGKWSLLVRAAGGRRLRVPIGDWPKMDVAGARRIARDLKHAHHGRAPSQPLLTWDDLLELYGRRRLSQLRSGAATHRSLSTGLAPLRGRALDTITKRHLSQAILDLADRAPAHANRTLAYARAMFGWAVGHGLMRNNPAATLPKPAVERPRERTPDLEELSIIWEAADQLLSGHGIIVQLLMLTAARRSEVGRMRVQDLHLPAASSAGWWTIPARHSKNEREIRVPLSPLARLVVERALAWRNHPQSPWLFTTSGVAPVTGWSAAKARLDRHAEACSEGRLGAFRLHDFRRSFATIASDRLGVTAEVVDRCLNHVGTATTSTVGRIYAHTELFDQRREALELWASLLSTKLLETGRAGWIPQPQNLERLVEG